MTHYRSYRCRGVIFLAFVFFAIQTPIHAQINPPKVKTKILLIDSASKGFSKNQLELFYTNLQKKVSQFQMLSVLLKSDLRKELQPRDKGALDSCSTLSGMQQLSSKIGVERIIYCTVTRQGTDYHFGSTEYGVKNSLKLSDVTEDATCTSSAEINDYSTTIAVAIGQKTTRTDDVPDSLSLAIPSWYWYAGGAVIVGVGTGIMLLAKQSTEEAVVDKTLPAAPDLP